MKANAIVETIDVFSKQDLCDAKRSDGLTDRKLGLYAGEEALRDCVVPAVTATLKLRRDRVVKRYDGIIEAMYEAPSLLRRSFTILQALTSAPNRKGASDG